MPRLRLLTSTVAGTLFLACSSEPAPRFTLADSTGIRQLASGVDDLMLAAPDSNDWPQHGRTRDEQRHSPLSRIDTASVSRLGIAWSYDLAGYDKMEATPIVVGGIMYATGPWNVVHAVDAATGAGIWSFEPAVHRRTGTVLCCGTVNRGVAVYRGRVYLGTLDGRLIALDAGTGTRLWDVRTTDSTQPYSITGAPRVGRGLVFIGNSGAEFGVRGYVSAYDAITGELRWRTNTVPGNPAAGFESGAMRAAARTWSGRWWEYGGGGTVWDAIVFDDRTNRLYVGTGNGSPWLHSARSPGGGDNLYLASILALDAGTGELVWHYQTVPGDTWDYTATQPLMLADLPVGGDRRSVVLQAPKNGFFYALDGQTGRFLSASPLVPVTWARAIDSVTGRPVANPDGLPSLEPRQLRPSPAGAHNWHPMAYNPATGLVYLTVADAPGIVALDTTWRYDNRQVNRGFLLGPTADPRKTLGTPDSTIVEMVAWDPVTRSVAWRAPRNGGSGAGVLSVGGGLVFAGRTPRHLVAHRARDGAVLWEMDTGGSVEAAPISYMVDSVQYIAVLVGHGHASSRFTGITRIPENLRGRARILAFALDAKGHRIPDQNPPAHAMPDIGPSELADVDAAGVAEGNRLYDKYCVRCHGGAATSWGSHPDLRFSTAAVRRRFDDIVRGGALAERGMPAFTGQLSDADLRHLQAYIVARARLAMRPGSTR